MDELNKSGGEEEKSEGSEAEVSYEKVDVKKLVSVIPPPSVLFSKQKQSVREKRIRLRYDQSVGVEEAKISQALARELGVKEYIEITVAGKKRSRFKAIVVDGLPPDYVYINPEYGKTHGIADNSICTVRAV